MLNDTRVSKWGNSLAIRIPRAIAREGRLAEGDRLTLDLATDGSIVLRSNRRRYELRQLVSQITTRNRHAETDWGMPVGRESCDVRLRSRRQRSNLADVLNPQAGHERAGLRPALVLSSKNVQPSDCWTDGLQQPEIRQVGRGRLSEGTWIAGTWRVYQSLSPKDRELVPGLA